MLSKAQIHGPIYFLLDLNNLENVVQEFIRSSIS